MSLRIGLALILVIPAVTVVVGGGIADAAAGTVTTAGSALTERAAPTTSAAATGSVANGATVTISCQTYAQKVTGHFGTSQVWDQLSDGSYVSDTYIYTGSDGTVAPLCAGATAENAAKWASAQVGTAQYEDLCELFVETAYGTSGRYASATADYNAQHAAGRIHSGTPPAGALAFFTSTTPAGHVMVAIGGGWAASTAPSSPIYFAHATARSDYLGWSTAPTSWPGR
jgi:uncharacterized protein YraI